MPGKEQINAQDCVCHECDLLVAVPPLHEGEQALCPRCDHVLVQLAHNPRQGPLVFVLSSLIMLACANLLPFLAINAKGMMNSMSLFQAASVLFSEDYRVLAIVVFLCMQLLPLSCLLLTGYLYLGLRLWRRSPRWALPSAAGSFCCCPGAWWRFFLVRVLVSLIKIASLADVSIGYGFWCFCAFCLMYLKCMLYLDRNWLWTQIGGPMPPLPLLHEGQQAREQGSLSATAATAS